MVQLLLNQVIVWEMGEMRTVKVLEGYHRRAVTTVKFSPDGRLLATMGADDHHGLAVYDWENSVLLCTTRRGLQHPSVLIWLGFSAVKSDRDRPPWILVIHTFLLVSTCGGKLRLDVYFQKYDKSIGSPPTWGPLC